MLELKLSIVVLGFSLKKLFCMAIEKLFFYLLHELSFCLGNVNEKKSSRIHFSSHK